MKYKNEIIYIYIFWPSLIIESQKKIFMPIFDENKVVPNMFLEDFCKFHLVPYIKVQGL